MYFLEPIQAYSDLFSKRQKTWGGWPSPPYGHHTLGASVCPERQQTQLGIQGSFVSLCIPLRARSSRLQGLLPLEMPCAYWNGWEPQVLVVESSTWKSSPKPGVVGACCVPWADLAPMTHQSPSLQMLKKFWVLFFFFMTFPHKHIKIILICCK